MSKVIFLDVDGTLVDYETKIPESAILAIRKARENGHRIYISAGRSKAEVYSELWEIGLDGMIGGNGSYVEDHEIPIFEQVLSEKDSKDIVDYLEENNFDYYLESNNGLFASKNFRENGRKTIQEYARRKGNPKPEHLTVESVFPDMVFDGELYRNDLNKVSYILRDYSDFNKTKEKFSHLKNGTWGGAEEKALFGDIGVAKIDKAKAIKNLLDYIGVDREDTIGIGDAVIDIPMLEFCNIGVAMGNSEKKLIDIADLVTDDVDKDGLYKAFLKLKLIEE